jgi:hypothetical protein
MSNAKDELWSFVSRSEAAQRITSQIHTEGYVVIPQVFSQAEVDNEYMRMWRWVQTVSPSVRKHDPSTWRRGRGDAWPCKQRDMMQLHQAGWVFNDLREAMADRVFENLYGTKELHCSKDGFTLQRPTETELGLSPNDHYDQGFASRGLQCIQGSIALTDQENDDGCFLCWPGSHRFHDQIMDWRGPKRGRADFVILDEREKEWLQSQGCEPKRVPVNRGDVILWRSDLVHKGAPPIGRRSNFRGVVYVCMLPAALTPEGVYKEKQLAYEHLQTGSHWPNREEWFEGRSQMPGLRPYFKKPPQLSFRQHQLYGLVRYSSTSVGSALTSPLGHEMTEANVTAFGGEVNESNDVKPQAAQHRRWGRSSASARASAVHAEADCTIPSRPPQPAISYCKEDAARAVVDDGEHARDIRRYQKALREIEALEAKQSSGEKLRRNQIDKIEKKEQYLQDLHRLTPPNGGA